MSDIGERIKKKRKELGMTQEDLSNKLGKSIAYNSCLLNGIYSFK